MFDRGADPHAIEPSAPALTARAKQVCRRSVWCGPRSRGEGPPCDLCRATATGELQREAALRRTAKKSGKLRPGDRIA